MLFEIMEKLDAVCYPAYIARGRRPWFPGYYTAKRLQIENAIDARLLRPGTVLPSGYGFKIDERIIEFPWVYLSQEIEYFWLFPRWVAGSQTCRISKCHMLR